MWPLPFLSRFSFFSCSTNVTRFLIVTCNPNICSQYVGEVSSICISSVWVAVSRAYQCEMKPALKFDTILRVPVTEQRSDILEPRACSHLKCKTQSKLQATLFTHFIEHHVQYTLHWHKMEKKKEKNKTKPKTGNGVRVDNLDTPFSGRIA